MVGLGFATTGLGLLSLFLRWRGTLYTSPLMLRFAVLMGPAGFIAVLAGWAVTEVGRQPFTISHLMRTAESVSPIGAPAVATSLAAFAAVYLTVFGFGVWYLLRLMSNPPGTHEPPLPSEPTRSAGITPAPAILKDAKS